jgi:hypothetical protein
VSTEEPPPEPDGEQPEESGDEGKPGSLPKPDPDAKDTIWFMNDNDQGDVAVRISDGEVQKRGTPTHLFSQVVDLAGEAIAQVGNLIVPPLVISARAGASMTVVFGEGAVDVERPQLLDRQVRRSAEDIGRLIVAENDALFSVALGVGKGAAAYADLARLVQTEGLTLDWKPRGQQVRRLDAARAAWQYEQLTRPPVTRTRPLRIEGLLYRAIMDRPGFGTAGLKLTRESPLPPKARGNSAVVRYETVDVEQRILHELLGQMIVATVSAEEIDPESTTILKPDLPHAVIEKIEASSRPVTLELFGEDVA